MNIKKKLQQKMRQTLYTPRNGKFSVLKTIKALDSIEKTLSDGVDKAIYGKNKKSKKDKDESKDNDKDNKKDDVKEEKV